MMSQKLLKHRPDLSWAEAAASVEGLIQGLAVLFPRGTQSPRKPVDLFTANEKT